MAPLFAPPRPLQCGPYTLPVGERTLIMGIINMTPDSFSGDSLGADGAAALAQARRMHAAGADLLDVGGLSTRPGAEPVSPEEELRRVVPVVERLAAEVPLPISVDTYRATVADAALRAGRAYRQRHHRLPRRPGDPGGRRPAWRGGDRHAHPGPPGDDAAEPHL